MKVIPVIDILNGVAVHAVRGLRSQYQPIQSIITKSAIPLEVAQSFKAQGFSELYVADLDAIVDCSSGFSILKGIVEGSGLNLMVDAGITSLNRAQQLLETGVSKLVIGTETVTSKTFIADALRQFDGDRIMISLDLKGDRVLAKPEFDDYPDPICLLEEFKGMGVRQVIVLDLARVGSGEGVNMAFLKAALDLGLEVYVGGGVRGIQDLVELKTLGASGVLIATALHTGKISVADLKREGFL
ncbi:MAG: HisA/HisF-related TIM barrel protein [Candidatus Bathyarchaeota archaeon]|nr:HisA/HisF-related TIM barrel protein [Candidatus Bathyarchaeota archaeon]